LREADVGKSRGEVTVPRLAELNSYVPVNLLEGQGEITTDMIKNFQVVVLTNTTLSKQIEIDEYCHNNGIAFIAADVRGLFGLVASSTWLTCLVGHRADFAAHLHSSYAFNDFGPKFTCVDPTGENPLSGIIASIDKVSTPHNQVAS
jgi:ubiquitin-activating enzyme E1